MKTHYVLASEHRKQMQLDDRYRRFIDHAHEQDFSSSDAEAYVRGNVLAAVAELMEALCEISWKEWASATFFNREAYLGELADVQLFLDNLKLMAMKNPSDEVKSVYELDEEFNAIMAKKIDNAMRRQREGYDGVTDKCPDCKRDKTAASIILGQMLCPCGFNWEVDDD